MRLRVGDPPRRPSPAGRRASRGEVEASLRLLGGSRPDPSAASGRRDAPVRSLPAEYWRGPGDDISDVLPLPHERRAKGASAFPWIAPPRVETKPPLDRIREVAGELEAQIAAVPGEHSVLVFGADRLAAELRLALLDLEREARS